METVTLELEIDPAVPGTPGDQLIDVNSEVLSENNIVVHVDKTEDGHGFGVSEIITISVTVAAGTTSSLLASAIKEATRGVVRRVRTRKRRSDGSSEEIAELIDEERKLLSEPPGDELSAD